VPGASASATSIAYSPTTEPRPTTTHPRPTHDPPTIRSLSQISGAHHLGRRRAPGSRRRRRRTLSGFFARGGERHLPCRGFGNDVCWEIALAGRGRGGFPVRCTASDFDWNVCGGVGSRPFSAVPLSPIDRRRNLIAVTAAMTATSLIYGRSVPLLSLILEDRGFDGTLIGTQTAVQ